MGRVELLVLGTCADHVVSVYESIPSAAMVVLVDGYPTLLVGAGFAAVHACRHITGTLPETVLLLSAEPSQTCALGAMLLEEGYRGRATRVIAQSKVMHAVRRALELELLGQPSDVLDRALLIEFGVDAAPLSVGYGLWVSAPSDAFAEVRERSVVCPTLLWAGVELEQAAIIASFTGPCRPLQWSTLLQAPFVVAWCDWDDEPAEPLDARTDVTMWRASNAYATHRMLRRWNNASAALGRRCCAGAIGHVSRETVPLQRVPKDDTLTLLETGSCVLLLETPDDLGGSPFESLGLASTLRGPLPHVGSMVPNTPVAGDMAMYHRTYRPSAWAPPTRPAPRMAEAATQVEWAEDRAPAQRLPSHEPSPLRLTSSSTPQLQTPRNDNLVPPQQQQRQQQAASPGAPLAPATSRPASQSPSASAAGRSRYRRSPTKDSTVVDASSIGLVTSRSPSVDAAASVHSHADPTAAASGRAPSAAVAVRRYPVVRRVHVFSNEEKGQPSRLLMVHKYPTLEAFIIAASEECHVRPASRLYFLDGRPVESLDDICADARLVLTKKGGQRYDPNSPPRLVRTLRL